MLHEKAQISELRKWRLDVIAQMLRIPVLLLGVFWSSEAGKKVLQLAYSELLYEVLNEAEEQLLYQLREACFKEKNAEKLIPSWMAIQLFLLHEQNQIPQSEESIRHQLINQRVCVVIRQLC